MSIFVGQLQTGLCLVLMLILHRKPQDGLFEEPVDILGHTKERFLQVRMRIFEEILSQSYVLFCIIRRRSF